MALRENTCMTHPCLKTTVIRSVMRYFFFLLYTNLLSQVTYEEYATEQSFYDNAAINQLPIDNAATIQGTERQEILAQSICTATAGPNQWVFAVERNCGTKDTCEIICKSKKLHTQAPQHRIVIREWRATAALHIYGGRPRSRPSTGSSPHLGFWVYRYASVNAPTGYCGPNYCCCSVAFSGPV